MEKKKEIVIPNLLVAELYRYAQDQAPIEACGYLAGQSKRLERFFPMENVDHSCRHFSFDPVAQFKVVREARNLGLELLAIFHSHPNSPATPSIEDIRLAYNPEMVYLILSLLQPEQNLAAYSIRDGKFQQIVIEQE